MADAVLDLTIVVPSYNPDEKLEKVIDGLRNRGFHDIVVVNDGSDKDHLKPFENIDELCTVIHHAENKGKGRAMKTAFTFCLESRKYTAGVITVDGDNQHHPDDVYACGEALLNNMDKLVLGCRDFSLPNVPFKSKYGNNITKTVFKVLCGLKVSDTQTGLRAFPYECLEDMIKIKGERYEYETNMLLETKNLNMDMVEVPIRTIYINDNESSHFNPIKDSIKIYGIILKFFANSIASTVIDLLLFYLFSILLARGNFERSMVIYGATIFARILSSLFNYKMNKAHVFGQGNRYSIIRYYVLCLCQMLVSASIVFVFSNLLGAKSLLSTLIKAVTDTCLFFVSFRIQKNWVFKREAVREKIEKGSAMHVGLKQAKFK